MWLSVSVALAADVDDPRMRLADALRDGERVYARGMHMATVGAAFVPAGLGAVAVGGVLFGSGLGRDEGVMFAGLGLVVTGSVVLLAAPPVISVGLIEARRGLRMRGLDAPSGLVWAGLGLYGAAVVTAGLAPTDPLGRAGPLTGALLLGAYVVTAVGYSQTVRQHHANPVVWVVPLVAADRTGLGITGGF